MRSSVYKQGGGENDPKVNRYKKISNAGKVLGVIPGVGIVVGAARIITTLTDNKQLYGDSNLKKAGFIARSATEIIGLGIVWGMADAVSSLFRALSGKKTENKEFNEEKRLKKTEMMNNIKSIQQTRSFELDGTTYEVREENLPIHATAILLYITKSDAGSHVTSQQFEELEASFGHIIAKSKKTDDLGIQIYDVDKALKLLRKELERILK